MDYVIKVYKDWKLHSQFTEIVPDMDDEMFFNEKQSIRDSSKSLKKYGSTHTCNHVRNNEIIIRHEIGKLDTLQGIALKYGCTTEQLRRSNRLFASDSLFMRQYLLIPVGKSSPYYPKDERPHSLPARAYSVATGSTFNTTLSLGIMSATTSPQQQTLNNKSNFNSNSSTNTSDSSKSMESVVMSPEEENKKSIDEFLGKIDSTIAESKKYVAKSQNNSTDMLADQLDDAFLSYSGYNDSSNNKHRYYQNSSSTSSAASHHTRHSSSGSTSDTAHLLNLNQGKRVQNSLQRLEKQQDEFFEL